MDTDAHRDDQELNSTPLTPEQRAAHEAADRQARIEYLRSLAPEKQHKPLWVKVVLTVLVVVVLVAIAGVLYVKLVDTNKDDGQAAKDTSLKTSQEKKVADTPVTATKTFSSTTFNLTLLYPEGWTAAEGNGKVGITSPTTQFKNAAGKEMTGRIVISIGPKGQNLTPFDAANATAVLDSEKLTYTQPTSVQRAQTYLSFAQHVATTAPGALDALYVTGDYGYKKDQAIPKVDMTNLDPLISVTFLSCADAACTTSAPTSVGVSNWNSKVFSTPITSTLQSLAVN